MRVLNSDVWYLIWDGQFFGSLLGSCLENPPLLYNFHSGWYPSYPTLLKLHPPPLPFHSGWYPSYPTLLKLLKIKNSIGFCGALWLSYRNVICGCEHAADRKGKYLTLPQDKGSTFSLPRFYTMGTKLE